MKTLLVALLLLAPAEAAAAGFYVGDVGTRGLSLGGAYVADPDTLVAVHYNPAGLANLRGIQYEASLTLLDGGFTFQRTCPCAPEAAGQKEPALAAKLGTPVENAYGFTAIPFLGLGYGFDWLHLTVALVAYGPHGAGLEFGPRGVDLMNPQPQRYSVVDLTAAEAVYALGFGIEPFEGFRVGGVVQNVQVTLEEALHIYANTSLARGTYLEDPSFDMAAVLKMDRKVGLNWGLGATWEPFEGLAVGASVTGKRSVRTEGTNDVQSSELLREADIGTTGNRVEIELTLPAIARAGIKYRHAGLGSVEVAGVYEGWSVLEDIVVRPIDIELTVQGRRSPLDEQVITRGWKDTWSLRIGLDFEALEPLVRLSAGYFFEPSAIPRQRLDPAAFDLPKHGLGFGVRTRLHGFALEVGIQRVFLVTQTVTDSVVEQGAYVAEENSGVRDVVTRVANGTYSGGSTVIGADLSFSWDEFAAAWRGDSAEGAPQKQVP